LRETDSIHKIDESNEDDQIIQSAEADTGVDTGLRTQEYNTHETSAFYNNDGIGTQERTGDQAQVGSDHMAIVNHNEQLLISIKDSGPEKRKKQVSIEYENVATTNYQKFVLNTGYKGFEPLPPVPNKPEKQDPKLSMKGASAVDQGDQKAASKPKKKRSSINKRIKTLEEI